MLNHHRNTKQPFRRIAVFVVSICRIFLCIIVNEKYRFRKAVSNSDHLRKEDSLLSNHNPADWVSLPRMISRISLLFDSSFAFANNVWSVIVFVFRLLLEAVWDGGLLMILWWSKVVLSLFTWDRVPVAVMNVLCIRRVNQWTKFFAEFLITITRVNRKMWLIRPSAVRIFRQNKLNVRRTWRTCWIRFT